MDALTFFPYWGILVLVIANGLLVHRMTIEIDNDESENV